MVKVIIRLSGLVTGDLGVVKE